MLELNSCIKVDKQIFLLKTISPTSLIERDKLENITIIFSTMKLEEFIAIAHKNSLKTN